MSDEERGNELIEPLGCAFDPEDVQVDWMAEYKRENIRHVQGKLKFSGKPVRRKLLNEIVDGAIKGAAKHGDVVTVTLMIQPPSFRHNIEIAHSEKNGE